MSKVTAEQFYDRSPVLWDKPAPPVPPLPAGAITMYPTTRVMWEDELNAHEAGLRQAAAAGDATAAQQLRELPSAVTNALAGNPHAADDAGVVDWLARRFPESNG